MNREDRIILCLLHEFSKPVIFDNGFHPVECFNVNNHRLFLVPGIRDVYTGYCGHIGITPVFVRWSINELPGEGKAVF